MDIRRLALKDVPDFILELESVLRRAQLDADIEALESLISDQLVFISPDGAIVGKTEDIQAHESGVIRFVRHQPLAITARQVGLDLWFVTHRARLEVLVAGKPTAGTFVYSRVWGKETSNCWRVQAGHVSVT